VRYGVHKVLGSLPAMTLTSDLLTLKSNQHIYKPKYICDQNWVKFSSLVLKHGVHKVFGMHRLTHSLTHSQTDRPDYRMPPASFFNDVGGIERNPALHRAKTISAICAVTTKVETHPWLFCILDTQLKHKLPKTEHASHPSGFHT